MFNVHQYQRYQKTLDRQLQKEIEMQKFHKKHKKEMEEKTQNYKSRVRDFFVKMANRPLQLGQYRPPIVNIMRESHEQKILANAQLYINGFKTNKQRLQRAVSDNKIIDWTPTPVSPLNHKFRDRIIQKEIQHGMRFQGQSTVPLNSKSVSKLAPLNPELKLHFKGLQEIGNKLKSMQQKQSDRIGLINKLQTVYGGKDIDVEQTSLDVLKSCKLLKTKTLTSLKSNISKTQRTVTQS